MNPTQLIPYLDRLTGAPDDYDELLSMADNARFVLIGEASHGTHEFYQIRADITKRLIAEKDFMAVAIEADWPDAYHINRYIHGDTAIDNAEDALSKFQRFPLWMWRNTEIRNFIDWLYNYNCWALDNSFPASLYGLDLYSLNSSAQSVIQYLEKIDPPAAKRARHRYGCFDTFKNDPQTYGYMTSLGIEKGCEDAVIDQMRDLEAQMFEYLRKNGSITEDEFFSAEQNARLIRNAETYYRALFKGYPSSWNIRDTHMAETLDQLAQYLETRYGRPAKIVVWAHNSHIGDASATEVVERGEVNLGQLVREQYPQETLLVGFTTYQGTVAAAPEWDEAMEIKPLLPALPDSYEDIFRRTHINNFFLNLRDEPEVKTLLSKPRLHRAVGVIYKPAAERWSHYYHTSLPQQFDAVIHLNHTKALEPLDFTTTYEHHHKIDELDTYPSGI